MSWWGKLLGGTFGFMLGGPLGALLGTAIGHQLDQGLGRLAAETPGLGDTERVQQAFFAATFTVMGHLAKADGRVSEAEISTARRIMAHMQLNPEQRQAAMRLFNDGKQDDFPLDAVLSQFKSECVHRHNLMQMFLEIQIATVLADNQVHPAERSRLHHIGGFLGFPPPVIDHLISMVGAQQNYETGGSARQPAADHGPDRLAQAYQLLGITPAASDKEVKNAYRRLMNQHHPDKLVAKGLPEEMMKLATEKTQEIRAAYDTILEARKSA